MINKKDIVAVFIGNEVFHPECFKKEHSYKEISEKDILFEMPEDHIAYCSYCKELIEE